MMRGLLLTACFALGAASSMAAPALPKPFAASYTLSWHGINAGSMDVEFKPQNGDANVTAYQYVSRANARGMFRAFFNEEVTQTSWLEMDERGVRPQRYRADDGSDDTDRDISLDFDWSAGRVTGTAENKPVSLPLQPDVQDVMSMQVVVTRDLMQGATPGSYTIVDKDKIKRYQYVREADARLKTSLGELDTVVYRAEREGSKRATRTWFAPSLGYTAVRAERTREGKREFLMEISSLKR